MTLRLVPVRFCGLLLALAVGSGCASTEMRGFTDPDFRDYQCKNLLVAARLDHLDQQAEAEDIFAEEFQGTSMTCSKSVDVLPPTRQFTDEEMFATLERDGIDAVLMIRQTEYYEDEKYIPETSTTNSYGTLSANTYYHGNTANTYGTVNATSYTHKSGGHYVSLPRVRHELQLYDVATKRVVWIGGAFTKGNSRAGFDTLISALARETKKALRKSGLVVAVTSQPVP